MKKYFGTDGIRGRVGEYPIHPEFVMKLGWAVGKVLSEHNEKRKVLIGKDTRISGYMFESALEAGLSAAGVNIEFLGPMPTPGVAYLTQTLGAQAGIVISASHNPYFDNGIKFFSADGTKLPDHLELEIEALLEQPMQVVNSRFLGKAIRINDAAGRYIEFCKSTIHSSYTLKGMKIVVDCAHGATYHIAPNVYRELGAEVITIGSAPDGLNINEHCGAVYPEKLKQRVLEEKADLGIALDGDGDRVQMIDHRGELVDGDELLYIMVQDRLARGKPVKGVVGTLMSNMGLELALNNQGIEFYRAAVGDRYVMQALKQNDWHIGGEASGHIVCLDLTTTGDGIVSSLQVLRALKRAQQSLYEAKQALKKFPQILLNIPVVESNSALLEHPSIQLAISEIKMELGHTARILVRASGTEPLIRIMVEGETSFKIESAAQKLADIIKLQIKS